MCSSFYPDEKAVEIALFNAGIVTNDEAQPRDKNIFMVAVLLVRGYVESSRSEGGTSVSVDREAVEDAINFWANDFGVAEEDILPENTLRVVKDGSDLW